MIKFRKNKDKIDRELVVTLISKFWYDSNNANANSMNLHEKTVFLDEWLNNNVYNAIKS
jgi:hypothetical protein